MKLFAPAMVVLAFAGSTVAAISDINGFHVTARNFNDHDKSVLTINGTPYNALDPAFTGTPPNDRLTLSNQQGAIVGVFGPVQFLETFPVGTTSAGGFANRHNAMFSADGGLTNYQVQRADSFFFQTSIRISGAINNAEGGLNFWMNRNVVDPGPVAATFTDEGFFNVRASDGEVAIFGGGLPFYSFGHPYVQGTTAFLGFAYYAPGTAGINPASGLADGAVEYFYNGVGSGIKYLDNRNDRIIAGDVNSPTYGVGGISNFALVGLRDQNQRFPLTTETIEVLYGEMSLVPTPAAAALMGLGGLMAGRRRRA